MANIDLGFDIWCHKEHLRLLGIDTPERGQEGFAEAREFIVSVLDQKGESDLKRTGSIWRHLATLYLDGIGLK